MHANTSSTIAVVFEVVLYEPNPVSNLKGYGVDSMSS